MSALKQINDFLFFILLGIVISCIFDIFRALRKMKKENSIYVIMIQDIIFFMIITVVTVVYMVNILKSDIRFYMLIAMIVGISISRKVISKSLIKFYTFIFSTIIEIIKFLCVPLELFYSLVCKIIKKVVKKCCKLFLHMINLKCKLITILKRSGKLAKMRVVYEKKSKFRGKEKSEEEEVS